MTDPTDAMAPPSDDSAGEADKRELQPGAPAAGDGPAQAPQATIPAASKPAKPPKAAPAPAPVQQADDADEDHDQDDEDDDEDDDDDDDDGPQRRRAARTEAPAPA